MPLLIIPLLFLLACAPAAPVTPADTLSALTAAVEKKDANEIYSLLSKESRQHLSKSVRAMKELSASQKEYARQTLGTTLDPAVMDELGFFEAWLFTSQEKTPLSLLLSEQWRLTTRDDMAVVRFEKGSYFLLRREGPYWLLDITDF